MTTREEVATYGEQPHGTARGERWAQITVDDGTYFVTAYDGWTITDEAQFNGRQAAEMAESVAVALVDLSADDN